MRFLLGGYTADMGGSASGIGMLLAGAADDPLAGGSLGFTGTVAAIESPSWLTWHPVLDVFYAALEGAGTVQAFRRTGETSFAPLGGAVVAGESPCHIAASPDGSFLIVTCWSDGRVVRMALDAAGRPSSPVVAPVAVDPYGADAASSPLPDLDLAAAARALREAAGAEYAHLVPEHSPDETAAAETDASARPSHAHQAVFLSGGVIATTDMGLDLVRFWRPLRDGLRLVQEIVLPRGCGPRHMRLHPSGYLYVVAELSCEAFVLTADREGAWSLSGGTSLGVGTLPGDTAAELAMSRDGRFVYAGVRGSNTLATLRVRDGGASLSPVAVVESGVDWPRHHIVVRDTLLVAGQLSNEVASLSLDERTGVPGRVRHRAEAPSPTCLVRDR